MKLLRYNEDVGAVIDRLRQNPFLEDQKIRTVRFSTTCEDSEARSFLSIISSFAPFADSVTEPITVLATAESGTSSASWLGSQQGNVISLYYPAFQNAVTLAFTFFHEFGHWVQKHLMGNADWEGYIRAALPGTEISTEAEAELACEGFANDFAWFCTNTNFLKLKHTETCRFFESLVLGNRC